jgi:hypothetical protein
MSMVGSVTKTCSFIYQLKNLQQTTRRSQNAFQSTMASVATEMVTLPEVPVLKAAEGAVVGSVGMPGKLPAAHK